MIMTYSPRRSGFQAFHLQASEDFLAETQLLARVVRVVEPSFISQIPQKQSKGHKVRSCVTLLLAVYSHTSQTMLTLDED